MTTAFGRIIDLLRLIEQGRSIRLGGPMSERDTAPWFKVIRALGLTDVDASMAFERGAALVEHPAAGEPFSLGPAIEALSEEVRALVRRMSERECVVAMMYWMYIAQWKTETKRIAATSAEISRQFGVEEAAADTWIKLGRSVGLVEFYRTPKPGSPDYYCLSREGLAALADPAAVLASLATRAKPMEDHEVSERKHVTYTDPIRCGHCGNTSVMRSIGQVTDHETVESDQGLSFDSGMLYEVCACQTCKEVTLRAGWWDENMEEPADWRPSVLHPDAFHAEAQQLLASRNADRHFMEMAVAEAEKAKSEPGKISPRVGAVVTKANKLIVAAYRGELDPGDHAEFIALDCKCMDDPLVGATVYTTLEPCTSRNHPKIPCVERIIRRKVSRVVIGMLDPNDGIRGRGVLALRKARVQVDLFPPDLMDRLEELNRDFIHDQESKQKSAGGMPTKPEGDKRERGASIAGAASRVLTANHFSESHGALMGVVLSSVGVGPFFQSWDTQTSQRIEQHLRKQGWEHVQPTPDGFKCTSRGAVAEVGLDGTSSEVRALGTGIGVSRRTSFPDIDSLLETMVRQRAETIALLRPDLAVTVRSRIWTLSREDLLEIEPGPADAGIDHFEGFRQHEISPEGLELEDGIAAGNLSDNGMLLRTMVQRFGAQVRRYCHTVRK